MSYFDVRTLSMGREVITLHKWGGNDDVGTAAFEVLWSPGGSYTGFLTAASAVRIKAGGNANDTAAGSGARTIRVFGLDQNWNEAYEDITTAGASASSSTTTTFIRVYRAFVTSVGSYGGINAGNIDIETTGGALVARVPAATGQTRMAIYTVPRAHTAYLSVLRLSVFGGKTASVEFNIRGNANDTSTYSPHRIISQWDGLDSVVQFSADPPFIFPEYTDIWLTAKADGGVSTAVYAEFDGILIANEDGDPFLGGLGL